MDRWLVGILAAFGALFVANGVMLYLAFSHPPEVEGSYREAGSR